MEKVATDSPRTIADYRVVDSGRSLSDVLAQINLSCFECYGPDLRVGPHPDQGRVTVDTLSQYRKLLRELAAIPNLVFVPHTELNDFGCPPDKIVCSIRHDVDADIRAAVAEAEIEHEYGARTSYYILHTAPYYGSWVDGVHYRNECMAILYRQIQDLGHEIALHTDPLHLYQNMKLNGAQAVRDEIDWLRAQGLHITGTVAHNSAPIYGIENFAIFKGKNRRGLGLGSPHKPRGDFLDAIVHNGKWAPLGVLDEAELGLTYEGNDFFRRKDIRVEYGATRYLNRWRWDRHLKRWRENKDPIEDRFVDQERMLHDIRTLEPGCWLILNVHPLYYGSRHAPTSAPAPRLDRVTTTINTGLGWETYEPNRVQAARGECETGSRTHVEFQSLNFSDERGMLDQPLPTVQAADELRVLVLGGRNLDGREVGIHEHAHLQASARLTEALGRRVRCRKLAFPGMGLCRHYAWFAKAIETERFDIVVLGVGADELANSHPDIWPLVTGWNARHPPGSYLWADEDLRVEVIERSAIANIHRNAPRPPAVLPSFADPKSLTTVWLRGMDRMAACLKAYAERVRAHGAVPIAILNECGESAGFWRESTPANQAAHAATLKLLSDLVTSAEIPMIDPYVAMLDSSIPSHWRSTGTWSHTGHRLAARAIYTALRPMLEQIASQQNAGEGDKQCGMTR